jgi:hypothetical protein
MAIQVDGVLFDELTSDPGTPVEGQMWYNSTTFLWKVYRNGVTTSFTDKAAFDAHATNTSNPHSTTLEQARTQNNALSGSIAMGGNAITGLGTGSLSTDAAQRGWVSDQITAKVAGLDWKESVISRLAAPPGSPVTGDRYLVIATGSGAWTGKEDQISEWSGAAWTFNVPNEGATTRVEAENLIYTFDGATWGNVGGAVQHSALLGLTSGDPHTQYQLRSEKGAASGYAGLQSDSTISNTTHGVRGGGTLHALVSASGHGFAPQSNFAATANPAVGNDSSQGYVPGSLWNNTVNGSSWVCISNGVGAAVWKETTNVAGVLIQKAGRVLNASFAGNPKKVTVTFATPFADTNYSVIVTPVTTGNASYILVVESQLAGSFVIDAGANNIGNLTQVNWHATKSGEST